MRKSYDVAFQEPMTLQELAKKYEVHPVQVSQWKRQLLDGADDVFERPTKKRAREREAEEEEEEERDRLLRTVGQLKVENDFLKKKHREWYGSES